MLPLGMQHTAACAGCARQIGRIASFAHAHPGHSPGHASCRAWRALQMRRRAVGVAGGRSCSVAASWQQSRSAARHACAEGLQEEGCAWALCGALERAVYSLHRWRRTARAGVYVCVPWVCSISHWGLFSWLVMLTRCPHRSQGGRSALCSHAAGVRVFLLRACRAPRGKLAFSCARRWRNGGPGMALPVGATRGGGGRASSTSRNGVCTGLMTALGTVLDGAGVTTAGLFHGASPLTRPGARRRAQRRVRACVNAAARVFVIVTLYSRM